MSVGAATVLFMGVRGWGELAGALPPAAASPLAAITVGLAELGELRLAACSPEQVRAVAEAWQRLVGQVTAGQWATLAVFDDRDDVVPLARAGQAGAVFGRDVAGHTRGRAVREAQTAALLRPEVGDLPRVGAALAAGDVTTGHVEVAVRAHRDLGQEARDAVFPYPDLAAIAAGCLDRADDGEPADRAADGVAGDRQAAGVFGDLAAAVTELLADPSGPSCLGPGGAPPAGVRQVLVVDAVLAYYARRMSVPELDAIARRLVEAFNPKEPSTAHERRYLHLSRRRDGTLLGQFECGPAQGALIQAVFDAYSAPRPGIGIDADGVEHPLPDDRDPGARRIDALTDICALAAAKNGITTPTGENTDTADAEGTREDADRTDTPVNEAEPNEAEPNEAEPDEAAPNEAEPNEPPELEGEYQVVRPPGVLTGPLPTIELIIPVGIEHLAAALAGHLAGHLGTAGNGALPSDNLDLDLPHQPGNWPGADLPGGLDPDLAHALHDWLHRNTRHRTDHRPDHPRPDHPRPDHSRPGEPGSSNSSSQPGHACGRALPDAVAALTRALSPHTAPARVEHAGPIDPATLRLLADNAHLRTALLSPTGAVLHLGRTHRLVTPALKRALTARDGGCIIPGCTTTADACQAHHVTPWTDGGPTDIDNTALVCLRHHIDITTTTTRSRAGSSNGWEIIMIDGVPWVRPPSWINRHRPLLRNAVHHPHHRRDDPDDRPDDVLQDDRR